MLRLSCSSGALRAPPPWHGVREDRWEASGLSWTQPSRRRLTREQLDGNLTSPHRPRDFVSKFVQPIRISLAVNPASTVQRADTATPKDRLDQILLPGGLP